MTASPQLHLPIPSYQIQQERHATGMSFSGTLEEILFTVASTFWITNPQELRLALILLAYRNALKIWLGHLAWGSNKSGEPFQWLY